MSHIRGKRLHSPCMTGRGYLHPTAHQDNTAILQNLETARTSAYPALSSSQTIRQCISASSACDAADQNWQYFMISYHGHAQIQLTCTIIELKHLDMTIRHAPHLPHQGAL